VECQGQFLKNGYQTKQWTTDYSEERSKRMAKEFKNLKELLEAKEKEVLGKLEMHKRETMNSLEKKMEEIKQSMENSLKAIAELDNLLKIEDTKVLAEKLNQFDTKLIDSQLEISAELSKSNQFLSYDYGNEVNFASLTNTLSNVLLSDKLKVVRWRVASLSTLASVEREISNIFRLFGFNW
jgi:alanyl-tRNA synthetase